MCQEGGAAASWCSLLTLYQLKKQKPLPPPFYTQGNHISKGYRIFLPVFTGLVCNRAKPQIMKIMKWMDQTLARAALARVGLNLSSQCSKGQSNANLLFYSEESNGPDLHTVIPLDQWSPNATVSKQGTLFLNDYLQKIPEQPTDVNWADESSRGPRSPLLLRLPSNEKPVSHECFPNSSNGSSFPHHLHKPPGIMPQLSFLHCLACKRSSSLESNHVAMLTDNTYVITRAKSSFLKVFSEWPAIQFWISNWKGILVKPWQNTKIT